MTTTIKSNLQESTITLYNRDRISLEIKNPELKLECQGENIISCRLNLQVDFETYSKIEQAGLFNLKKEVRGSLSQERFYDDLEVYIEAELKPNLLPQLTKIGTSKEEITNYLINFSPEDKPIEDNIICTESWYCLTVGQEQSGKDVGYRTLWNHANPSTINQAATSTGEALQGVVTFLQQAVASYKEDPKIKAASQELEQEFSKFFQQLGELNTEENNSELHQKPISEVMLDFFSTDDWDYYWWEEGETLQLECQVSNGRLTCYAKAINDKQQFVFYTLCPLTAPDNRKNAISEFITKVNYGMVIGNFEFDYSDGEIRYKTSIDVEGDRLSNPLIKQAVYLNVLIPLSPHPKKRRGFLPELLNTKLSCGRFSPFCCCFFRYFCFSCLCWCNNRNNGTFRIIQSGNSFG